MHKWWANIDFVSIWKASSIMLTGAFGILGLLTEFKDKEKKKITKWGRVSLIGIVVTTVFGVAAQLRESADDAAKALALAQKSDRTLTDIEKALIPLGQFAVVLGFNVSCYPDGIQEGLTRVCKTVQNNGKDQLPDYVLDNVRAFPKGSTDVEVFIFTDPKRAQQLIDGGVVDADLWLKVHGSIKDKSLREQSMKFSQSVSILIDPDSPDIIVNSGRIQSLLDIFGSTVVLSYAADKYFMVPDVMQVVLKDVRGVIYNGSFKKVKMGNENAYEFVFPKRESTKGQSSGSSGGRAPGSLAPE